MTYKPYYFTAKNPNGRTDPAPKPPTEFVVEIEEKRRKIQEILYAIKKIL